jgi:hypothetical protein
MTWRKISGKLDEPLANFIQKPAAVQAKQGPGGCKLSNLCQGWLSSSILEEAQKRNQKIWGNRRTAV